MDCPKCIGKLQKKKIRIFSIDRWEKRINLGVKWGERVRAVDVDTKKKETIDIDQCFVCEGIWFDKGELKKFQQEKIGNKTVSSCLADKKLYKELNEKGGLCPKCKKPMRIVRGKNKGRNVLLDLCPKCEGVWLDGGEVNNFIKGLGRETSENIYKFFWSNNYIKK